ncbi:MAG: caspase family protein [Spirochaetales bacterium]|nr:caspase family protein [Spirochaetales bacterium]
MLRIKKLFSIFVIAGLLSSAFSQEAKNALLIANGDYSEIKSLSQPVPEGEDLKNALESIGFSVTFVKNANRDEMFDSLLEFRNKTKKAGGIAFFHYGGHAVQIDEKNYLIPVNSKIDDEEQIRYRCVELDEVMDSMTGESNVVVLDSCRNDPFPNGKHRGGDTRGLAAVSRKPKNSIIVYSAEAGETALDGVYTPALTKRITEKGKSIEEVLKEVRNDVLRATAGQQLPGEYRQLVSDVYLAGRSSSLVKQTGSIIVTSDIEGDLYLDSDFKCHIRENGPQKIEDLQSGKYYLEIRSGEKKFFENILVEADKIIDVFIKSGGINLLSNVSGEVYLNGKRFGYVETEKELELSKLGSGIYKVEVKSADGFVFIKNAEVKTGEKTSVQIQAAKATVQVSSLGKLTINGKDFGEIKNNKIVFLPNGEYKFSFAIGKQKPKEEKISTTNKSSFEINFKTTKLAVESLIDGRLYIDGIYYGYVTKNRIFNVDSPLFEGQHNIEVVFGKTRNWSNSYISGKSYSVKLNNYKNDSFFNVDSYSWATLSIGVGIFGGYRTILDNDNVGLNAGIDLEYFNFFKVKGGFNYYINDNAESVFDFSPCGEIYLFNNKRIAFSAGVGADISTQYTSIYFPLNLELRINNKFLLYGDYCIKSNAVNVGIQYNFLRL